MSASVSSLCGYCIPGSSRRAPARWHLASALSLLGSLPSAELRPPTNPGSSWGRRCQPGLRSLVLLEQLSGVPGGVIRFLLTSGAAGVGETEWPGTHVQ